MWKLSLCSQQSFISVKPLAKAHTACCSACATVLPEFALPLRLDFDIDCRLLTMTPDSHTFVLLLEGPQSQICPQARKVCCRHQWSDVTSVAHALGHALLCTSLSYSNATGCEQTSDGCCNRTGHAAVVRIKLVSNDRNYFTTVRDLIVRGLLHTFYVYFAD